MSRLILWFSAGPTLCLEKTLFRHPAFDGEAYAIRAKIHNGPSAAAAFHWSPAVRAMAILMLRTAALGNERACLIGPLHSPAAALDSAISKTPRWLQCVFGRDRGGSIIARRLFPRSNPERKRPGPVAVTVNHRMLEPAGISILINGVQISDAEQLLASAASIERGFADAVLLPPLFPAITPCRGFLCPECGRPLEPGPICL